MQRRAPARARWRFRVDGKRAGWVLRGVALVAVFACAVWGLRSGVEVSDRPGLPSAGWLTHLYYAAGLFVLGGLDLGTPSAGPAGALALVWGAYFLAPLITTSAVIEGALRLVGATTIDRLLLRQHVVLVGLGRLANTFVAALREREPRCPLVALERDAQRPSAVEARRQHGVRIFAGDAQLSGALAAFRLHRARAVALLTDDDLLNLEVAYRLAKVYPELSVVAHVADVGLQRAALELASTRGVRVFNAHRVVAEFLYRSYLHPYFEGTLPKDAVVLAGFGRFGQAILELLEGCAAQALSRVVVVDHDAEASLRTFRDHVPISDSYEVHALDADLADVQTWARIADVLGSLAAPPVIVIGSQHEGINLQGALQARRLWPAAPVFTRCQNQSAFSEELAAKRGFTVLAVDAMLRRALRLALGEWLAAPGARVDSIDAPAGGVLSAPRGSSPAGRGRWA